MTHLRKLGLAGAMALVTVCGAAGSASATTVDPTNTNVTATSTNSTLAVVGSSPNITCSDSTITGNTGSATGTWVAIPITITYNNCAAFGFPATVLPSEPCHTSATQPILHGMGVDAASAAGVVTLRGCTFHVVVHATGCTLSIPGNQTIGNGTNGAGGIAWTNLSPKSTADLNNATLGTIESNGVGLGCPSAGSHNGVLAGNYPVTSATNVTVTP